LYARELKLEAVAPTVASTSTEIVSQSLVDNWPSAR